MTNKEFQKYQQTKYSIYRKFHGEKSKSVVSQVKIVASDDIDLNIDGAMVFACTFNLSNRKRFIAISDEGILEAAGNKYIHKFYLLTWNGKDDMNFYFPVVKDFKDCVMEIVNWYVEHIDR